MTSSSVRTIAAALSLLLAAASASAATNIDIFNTGKRYAWSENGGWLNLQGDISSGVYVGATVLRGFAWHENFGWINFGSGAPAGTQYSNTSAEDFGVNIDPAGNLSGYAWGENIGWIAFDTQSAGGASVKINKASGRFSRYAWGENIGWLAFENIDHAHVATAPGFSAARNWTLY